MYGKGGVRDSFTAQWYLFVFKMCFNRPDYLFFPSFTPMKLISESFCQSYRNQRLQSKEKMFYNSKKLSKVKSLNLKGSTGSLLYTLFSFVTKFSIATFLINIVKIRQMIGVIIWQILVHDCFHCSVAVL